MSERYRQMMAAGLLLAAVLLAGCSADGEPSPEPVLNIYVYSPGNAIQTRSVVDPLEEEKKVTKLQIWVYKHNDGTALGTLSLEGDELAALNDTEAGYYSMAVPRDFAENPENVDVYVLANVTNANCNLTIDRNVTRELINNYSFGGGYYQYPVVGVSDDGIPMSGVLRDRAVTNDRAVLHISGTNLQLMRTVSKIRFAFSASSLESDNIYIDRITLGKNMLPQVEYLFLDGADYRVGNDLVQSERTLVNKITQPIRKNEDPTRYIYVGTDGQTYESLIDQAAADGLVTVAPVVYMRESDKKLTGTIDYHVNNEADGVRHATFTMQSNNFPRNHTWIVYAFYGASTLEVNAVQVNEWENGGKAEHEVHNW